MRAQPPRASPLPFTSTKTHHYENYSSASTKTYVLVPLFHKSLAYTLQIPILVPTSLLLLLLLLVLYRSTSAAVYGTPLCATVGRGGGSAEYEKCIPGIDENILAQYKYNYHSSIPWYVCCCSTTSGLRALMLSTPSRRRHSAQQAYEQNAFAFQAKNT